MKKITQNNYNEFFCEIKERIRLAQYDALKAVNKELIALYWDIGKMIIERQNKYGWGKAVVETLASDLQAEFPGMQGYSTRNIWYMRTFYMLYCENKKLQPLVAEISWTKHLAIIDRCHNDFERDFYIKMTKKLGWTKYVLIHQIENKTYEKTMLNQTNFGKVLPDKIRNQAKLAVKDEYTFDFLELGEEHSEMELEQALIAKINKFLVEMGGMFAFMGNQFRLEIDGEEFFIDILLYHRRLKCLVAVELKVGKFIPEHVGKMQFYLAALDNTVKEKDENPSIGIILCKEKKRTIVEYALKESKKPIGISQYKIMSKLPKELKGELPTQDEMQKLLADI
jgi:predicted nuclease of restriction endonuclease-like (RecB) superfamily